MLVHVLALLSAAGLVVNAASIPLRPRQAANSTLATQSTYIACVADTKIPSLTSSVATSATSREECSNTCSQDNWEIAYFRQDTSQCYCSPASDYPTSDEVVYAVDDQGNCRSEDDASVEYLHSPYALSGCYLYLTSEPISNVTASSPWTVSTAVTQLQSLSAPNSTLLPTNSYMNVNASAERLGWDK